jgi:hypothetical protein
MDTTSRSIIECFPQARARSFPTGMLDFRCQLLFACTRFAYLLCVDVIRSIHLNSKSFQSLVLYKIEAIHRARKQLQSMTQEVVGHWLK